MLTFTEVPKYMTLTSFVWNEIKYMWGEVVVAQLV